MVIGVVAAESTRQRSRKAILLHSCPRCHGDLFLQAEEEGEEFVCLQCAGSVPATMIAGIPRAEGATLPNAPAATIVRAA